MKKYLLIATALVLAAACQKEPSASDFDGEYLVYTAHSEDIEDFSGFSTFTIADSLLVSGGMRFPVRTAWTDKCAEPRSR